MVSKEFHQNRREALIGIMETNTAEFYYAGEEKQQNGDQNYPFCPEADFYYLTGFEVAKAVLLAIKRPRKAEFILFVNPTTPKQARWLGVSYTKESVSGMTGIEDVRYLEELDSVVERIKKRSPKLVFKEKHSDLKLLRQVKTKEEIALHRVAAEITTEGVNSILENMQPGMYEYQIEAYFDFALQMRHAAHAFGTIAATGPNANIMHYWHNNTQTKDGEMMLFDLGAEWGHYACDVSRTYPVNGKFTDQQKQLYTVVLDGLKAAEAAAKPGYPKDQLQLLSKQVMAKELVELGFIKEESEIDKYYMHGSGHYIGLFVHDVGNDSAPLEPDMMFTLEPGLYFDELGLGIRIEDTLLVTEDGVEIFSANIPKEIDEIEAVMAKAAKARDRKKR